MTREQERAIEVLEKRFLEFYGHPENKEVKTKTVEEFDTGIVYVMLEVGYIGDEGTMQEYLCRNTLSVLIGKQGGYFNFFKGDGCNRRYYKNATLVCCHAQWKL